MNINSTKSHEPRIAHSQTISSKAPLKRLLFAFLLVCGHFALTAATITVTNGNDDGMGSLRAAIASAASGDDIDFNFGMGDRIVTLTSAELQINKNLIINGGTGVTVTRDAGAANFRIFNITGGSAVVEFNKLSITNGKGAGQAGGVQNSGTLTLNDCTIANNESGQGGGIQNDLTLTMNRCFVHSNKANTGSGLLIYGSSTTLNNCVFTNNQGAYAIDMSTAGTLTITNCAIAKNTGGGIKVTNSNATVTLKNTIVAENTGTANTNINNNVSASSAYNLIGTEGGNGGLTNGTNNNFVGSSPLFANSSDPDGADEIFGTADDGLRLLTCSPALNAGNTADAPAGKDIVGNSRTFGANVDMGAYEAQAASTPLPTITLGTIPNTILAGATTFNIPYTATGLPTTYSISGTGFTTLTDAALPSSPITVNLSPAASINIDFILTVKSASGCTSSAKTGSIAVLTPLTDACATANFNGTAPIAPTATTTGVGGKGGIYTYTVPAGVTAIRLDARGAKGGSSPNHFNNTFVGGQGGRMQATYAVTPGDVLYILVGGKGGNGSIDNGVQVRTASGGGGATVVSKGPIGTGTLLLVAGGGGGAGHSGGGGNSNNAPNTGAGAIGAGGASFSANGGNSTVGDIGERDCGQGGQALNAGGNGGANACFRPETNGGGYGGGGAGNYSTPNGNAGGGGGGGYVGGNAGGTAGGNGGSSYTDPSATNRVPDLGKNETHTDDNGSVVISVAATISYTGSPFCKSLTATAAPTTTGYTGGTFSAIPTGLTIDATTGVINPSTSAAGSYLVRYNTLVGCPAATTSVKIGCLEITTPIVGSILCQGGSTTISAIASGGSGTIQYSLNGGAYQTNPVFTVQAGTYTITAKEGSGSTISTSPITVRDGFSVIQCPQTAIVDALQMSANGTIPTSISGEVFINNQCFTPTSTAVSDQVFDVVCGVVSPQSNNFFAPNSLADAQKVLVRTFSAKASIFTYSCAQTIYVRQYKMADIEFPSDISLTCPNLRTEPNDTVIDHYAVWGTGSPRLGGVILNSTIHKSFISTYTDVRTTTATGFTINRTWTVKKCADNTRTFVQTIKVTTCNPLSIAGRIGREDGMAIPATTVLFNSTTGKKDSTTGANYTFANLLTNSKLQVQPERPNTDWTNGVTTFDVALISRHVLGIAPLATPYQMIAADANRNGEVDAADLLHLQRLILRLDNQLPNNNSWRFVPKNYQFLDPTNPFASDFPEVLNVSNLTNAVTNGDFVAIKIGDVNNSLGLTTIRGGAEAFKLSVEDKVLEKNLSYEIPVRTAATASAIQYALTIDKTLAQIEAISKGDLPNCGDNNFGFFKNENTVTAAWTRSPNQKIEAAEMFTMVNLVIKPTKTVRLSEILTINPVYTEGVAYDEVGKGAPVKLSFGNKISEGFALYQNHPNPFSDETTISFKLPQDAQANLTITSVDGKILKKINGDYKAGLNTLVVKKSELQTSGVFYYRLETADFSAIKKLVIME